MSDTYCWTLSEYALRCEDGRGLVEVLTEGALDRDVFADAVRRWGLNDAVVMGADFVRATTSELASMGLSSGAKGTLIAVAIQLEDLALKAPIAARIAVVVDRDYDGSPGTSRFLFVTDGHSIESYALDRAVLERFMSLGLGRGDRPAGPERTSTPRVHTCSGGDVLERLTGASLEIAAVRLALLDASPRLALISGWLRYVDVDANGHMAVDGELLLSRVLKKERAHPGSG